MISWITRIKGVLLKNPKKGQRLMRTDKMTYTFNLGPQQTRTFSKPV